MTDDLIPLSAVTPAKPKFRRRWRVRLVTFLVLVVALVWFAPAIAAKTMLNWAVGKATADLKGTAHVGGASLGWFSSVELTNVTVADATGRPLVTVPKVTTSKTLLGFVLNQSELGTVTVEKPAVEIVCENGSTNLEAALDKFLQPSDQPAGERPGLKLVVADGSVSVKDGEKVRILSGVAADVTIPRAATEAITVKGHAQSGAGTLDADLTLGDTLGGKLVAADFPLDVVEPFARRADPTLTLGGTLTADATATVTLKDGKLSAATANGRISAGNLRILAAALGAEPISLSKIDLPLDVRTEGNLVRIEKADLSCDFGTASVGGTLDAGEPLDKILSRPGLKASADIDLAKLAALAPKFLRVRDGTAIQDGRISATLASTAGANGVTWDGTVRTSALRGTRDGKPLVWDKPLEAAFAGRLGANMLPAFDKLDVTADFASVSARGSVDRFGVNANVNLDALAARLGDFLDLGSVRLGGSAKLELVVQPKGSGSTADGKLTLTNLRVADGPRELREQELLLKIVADGKYTSGGPVALDSATITLDSGADSLALKLLEPMADVREPKSGRATASISGDLARWKARIAPFVSLPPDWQLAGTGTVTAAVRFDADRITVADAQGDLTNIRFAGAGLTADEPQVKLYPTTAVIERGSGRMTAEPVQFASQTLGFAAKKVTLTPTAAGYDIDCDMKANANLGRVQRLLKLQSDPKLGDAVGGMVESGSVKLSTAGGKYRFQVTAPVKGFTYGTPTNPTWSEPTLTLTGDGEYDPAADSLSFTSVRVERPQGLAAEARGGITKLTTTTDVDLTGKLTYDLATLEPQLKSFLGQSVKVTGKDARDFKLAGSLAAGPGNLTASVGKEQSPYGNLNGNAAVAWETVQAYGFDVGKAEVKANLAKGIVTIDPVEAAFGQTGKVRLEPTVKLLPAGTEISFATGKVVDRATLTPKACADALGYALPPLAKSTEAEGTISLELGENRIPLSDPEKAYLVGNLTLHQVKVGPGPLVTELGGLIGAKLGKMTLANEQVVPVQVKDGRVYHDKLSVTMNGYTITTSGSVGIDGTMKLIAEVPVPESAVGGLLKNNPRIKDAVANKRISVAVGGTVDRPQLDRGGFATAVRQFVTEVTKEAAGGLGKDLFKKELDKLLPKPADPKKQ